jgi:hypothetical protein
MGLKGTCESTGCRCTTCYKKIGLHPIRHGCLHGRGCCRWCCALLDCMHKLQEAHLLLCLSICTLAAAAACAAQAHSGVLAVCVQCAPLRLEHAFLDSVDFSCLLIQRPTADTGPVRLYQPRA